MHLKNGWLPKNFCHGSPALHLGAHTYSTLLRLMEYIQSDKAKDIDFAMTLYNDLKRNSRFTADNVRNSVERKAKGYVFKRENLLMGTYKDINSPALRFMPKPHKMGDIFNGHRIHSPSTIKVQDNYERVRLLRGGKTRKVIRDWYYVDPLTYTHVPFHNIKKPSAYCPKACTGVLRDH